MPFECIYTCERVSLDAHGITLHAITPLFQRGSAAAVIYCRLTRMPFDSQVRYRLQLTRVVGGGSFTILNSEERLLSLPSRLYPKQIVYAFAPPGGLQVGYYGVTIDLNNGERAETEFMVI